MTDPRRLLEGGGTDIERCLLESDGAEAPDAQAKQRVALALAIGTVSVWPTAAYATAKTAKAGVPLIVKLLAIGAVGAGTFGTARYVLSRSEPAPAIATSKNAATPHAAFSPVGNERAIVDPPRGTDPIEGATASESPQIERLPDTVHRAPSAVGAAAPVPAEAASIADEIRMLDEARRAQAAGDGAGAIRALDDYQRKYPRGALAEESALLRIEALARLGKVSAAKGLAQKFRAAHPNSPHLRRIESVLAEP